MSSLVFPGVDAAPSGPTVPGLNDPSAVNGFSFAEASSESSSIGSPSDEEDQGSDGQDEAESKSTISLGSLISLEDSLPIKKSLSNHFVGKSRSFCNLSECASGDAGDLVKQESPFNKRRRIQIVNKISYKRRASYSSLITPILPPLLSPEHAVQEAEDENDDKSDDDDDGRGSDFRSIAPAPHGGNLYNDKKKKKKAAALKSPRSFPLFDLRYV